MIRATMEEECLPKKEFNSFLDTYIETEKGNLETLLKMSPSQQAIIQEVKKSIKRLKYKYEH